MSDARHHDPPYPESESARLARAEERILSVDRHLGERIGEMSQRINQRFELNDRALAAALLAAKEAVSAALIAAKEAVDKAEAAASKRFEENNKFREQLSDQATTFMRQDVSGGQFEAVNRELTVLRNQITAMAGHDSGAADSALLERAKSTIRIAVAAIVVSLTVGIAGILVAILATRSSP